ncbi:FtsB family cell division protein [Streptomyces avicenniae]|uniref:FtsB family cell division protein n=1 Tax=Streptomyces avicenniae TaxID=500153 RepID=UPI00069B831B|nr:septum formation initiator family protein [Streptomyces avicenniae]
MPRQRAEGQGQTRLLRLAGLVPRGSSSAARTPFVLLVVLLLGSGMLGLLLLNASLNEGSFALSELRRETRDLTDEQQELQAEVDGYSAPDALAERARELGMVPAGPPAFLAEDGTLLGETDPEPAPSPTPTAPAEDDEAAADEDAPDAADAPTGDPAADPPPPGADTVTGRSAPGAAPPPAPDAAASPSASTAPAPSDDGEGPTP